MLILDKSFVLNYSEDIVYNACCEVIRSIPKQEFQIMNTELQTIHTILHDYPITQRKTKDLLWAKESYVSIFIHVSPIDSQSSNINISTEAFLVPLGPSCYQSASCQLALAYFLKSLLEFLKRT